MEKIRSGAVVSPILSDGSYPPYLQVVTFRTARDVRDERVRETLPCREIGAVPGRERSRDAPRACWETTAGRDACALARAAPGRVVRAIVVATGVTRSNCNFSISGVMAWVLVSLLPTRPCSPLSSLEVDLTTYTSYVARQSDRNINVYSRLRPAATSSAPMNASSAPWSSPPSLQLSVSWALITSHAWRPPQRAPSCPPGWAPPAVVASPPAKVPTQGVPRLLAASLPVACA